ncbi:MAG: ATP-dependent DNA helicase II subunit 2 [Vezdaea aestivalis]|nr:MAG: ATP-dependent DNA helicase II subunit 2 [Vezdaea aestivalis]
MALKNYRRLCMKDIRYLQKEIKPSNTNQGDIVSAIILAMMHMIDFCKQLKYVREIVVITNGLGGIEDISSFDTMNIAQFKESEKHIAKDTLESKRQQLIDTVSLKLAEEKIQLTVLGVDFDIDTPSFKFKEDNKPHEKRLNEDCLREIVQTSGGRYGTLAEAIAELEQPLVKQVKPVTLYKGELILGKPGSKGALSIQVERYPCIKAARAITASAFAKIGEEDGAATQTSREPPSSMPVNHRKSYRVEDHTQKTGWREVDEGSLSRGYEYGRTVVPFLPEDEHITKFETTAAFEIIGLIKKEQYKRYYSLSDTSYTVAASWNPQAKVALSGLIHALFETEAYAVARLVAKDKRNPVMVLLAPCIETGYECLVDVTLPFAEDRRQYGFAPLDRVVTVTGKVLKEHRNLPNADLQKAMSDYVDSVNLDLPGPTTDMFNPSIHHLNSTISHRAIYPTEPLPSPNPILLAPSQMHPDLVQASAGALKSLITKAYVKKVPPKTQHRRDRNAEKPLSGLDMDALLSKGSKTKNGEKAQIDSKNPVPSFKRLLDTTTDPNGINDLARQMIGVIKEKVKNSFGDSEYRHEMFCLSTLRQEMIELEEPDVYNELIREFKKNILAGELGGNRDDIWFKIRKEKLGLVTDTESSDSNVREEDARQFLRQK